jgi:hypothetical protein
MGLVEGIRCKSENQNTKIDELKPEIKINEIGTKYFDFDEIDYYYNDFDESKIDSLNPSRFKSELDSFQIGIVCNNIPESLPDLSFMAKLEMVGFVKK